MFKKRFGGSLGSPEDDPDSDPLREFPASPDLRIYRLFAIALSKVYTSAELLPSTLSVLSTSRYISSNIDGVPTTRTMPTPFHSSQISDDVELQVPHQLELRRSLRLSGPSDHSLQPPASPDSDGRNDTGQYPDGRACEDEILYPRGAVAEELERDLFAEQGEERGCLDVSFSFFIHRNNSIKNKNRRRRRRKRNSKPKSLKRLFEKLSSVKSSPQSAAAVVVEGWPRKATINANKNIIIIIIIIHRCFRELPQDCTCLR
ncbi:hypothetical protein M432DRAFT_162612 [Thermoascus aurantiacus ATCC 26904]